MSFGIMKIGKAKHYLKPKWLNTVTYKEAGFKQYRWLSFYWTKSIEGRGK